jgi:hypothetical protein
MLVGVMVAMVVVGGSVSPASAGVGCPETRIGEQAYRVNPMSRVVHEKRPSAGAEFGFAVAATVLNIVYTPVRMVYGATGAALGGFSGWVSGGDLRTAKGWWVPTTEGDYYVRPAHFDGSTRFRVIGAVPPTRPLETFDEPLPPSAAEPTEGIVVPEDPQP